MSCRAFFKEWVERSKDLSGVFFVREIQTGLVWNSRDVVNMCGLPKHEHSWEHTLSHTVPEDARRIEDAHSLALKTGGIHKITVRCNRKPGLPPVWFRAAVEAHICPQLNCERKCAIVLHAATPVAVLQER